MKIRRPALIKAAGFAGAWLVRGWMGTLRCRYRALGPEVEPHRVIDGRRFIYAMWHENLLLPAYCYARANVRVLVSQHADGQLLAEVCRHLRIPVIRGSTTRGGVEAVRRMLRAGREAHLAMTPDGPRGPRRQVQPGLVYLAARTGLPVVPVGVGYDRPWRLRSWDRFAVPRPWSRANCVTAEPITVPADADREELERYRLRVEDALGRVGRAAERWAETGRVPGLPAPQTPGAEQRSVA
jgi:lysophospholipid acyltransferase (LPLAT)-like uncharacterized protein